MRQDLILMRQGASSRIKIQWIEFLCDKTGGARLVPLLREAKGGEFSPKNSIHWIFRRQGKQRYRIYICIDSMDILRSIVEPYIVPSMRYKLTI